MAADAVELAEVVEGAEAVAAVASVVAVAVTLSKNSDLIADYRSEVLPLRAIGRGN
jgi:hypothetical protein